jgi:hypothetical protein
MEKSTPVYSGSIPSASENVILKKDIAELYKNLNLDYDFDKKSNQDGSSSPDLFSYTYYWFK